MYVFKVFRNGTFLQDLQKQWPQGMFQNFEEFIKDTTSLPIKFTFDIMCGTILPNGRFAFFLVRENEVLQTFIDRKMKARTSPHSGPFPIEEAIVIAYRVGRGMDWLHNLEIVHRDLKASNVLCTCFNKNSDKEFYAFSVADYECSIGVVGIGFFRAPEILQAIKDKVVNERPNLFTKAFDVYSYRMVCYEILTGKLPFEGHPTYDFDLVIKSRQQLEVPHYIDECIRDLLQRCWQFDPITRPTFGEILKLLEANSEACKRLRRKMEELEMMSLEEQRNTPLKYEFKS